MKLVSEKQSMHKYVYIHMIKEIDDVFIFSYTHKSLQTHMFENTLRYYELYMKLEWVISNFGNEN